ncbi:SET and MYND domain-containing protein 4 [Taenia solium]|eukprot:TsM_000377400 transcript=TsM_000377400 gene=TsM_000377400
MRDDAPSKSIEPEEQNMLDRSFPAECLSSIDTHFLRIGTIMHIVSFEESVSLRFVSSLFGAVCSAEMECLKSGSQHELVKAYFKIVLESMSRVGKKKEWLKEFGENKTDFQRVCYLLRALGAAGAVNGGIEVLGLPSMREAVTGLSGKSDEESTRIREHSNRLWESRKVMKALAFYTIALFHAASDSVKALALGNRSCVLFSLKCFKEAAADASEALKLGFPQSKAARLHIRIAQCRQRQDRLPEARRHFQEAITLLDHSEASMRTLLLPLAEHGLLECGMEQEKTEPTQLCPSESLWKCIRYKPPTFSKFQTMKAAKDSSDTTSGASCRLLSAPDGTLCLRNTGHKRGWALEVTRDVSVVMSILHCSMLHFVKINSRAYNLFFTVLRHVTLLGLYTG